MRIKPMSPKRIDDQLRCLINYLNLSEEKSFYLKFQRPKSFYPEANNCHLNVWCMMNNGGGHQQPGWILVQDKSANFAEAIFHCVWVSPEGKYVDVTPRMDSEKRILFVPDFERSISLSTYNGMPAINTYQNVKLIGQSIINPLTRFTAVLNSDFAQRNGLFRGDIGSWRREFESSNTKVGYR